MLRFWAAAQQPLVLTITRDIVIQKGDPRLYGKLRKLPITLLFTSRTDSKVNNVEKYKQAYLHQLGQKIVMNF